MHPCRRCGACCAAFRVAFHWSEAEAALGGTVPVEATHGLDPHRRVMRGTDRTPIRCIGLVGRVGVEVGCDIYARRPSPCRELTPAWEDGRPSPQCDRARLAHGLVPLQAEDWLLLAPPVLRSEGPIA